MEIANPQVQHQRITNPLEREVFGLPSTIWFLGGKQATYMYARKVITPMIKEGINPGDMLYQPFK